MTVGLGQGQEREITQRLEQAKLITSLNKYLGLPEIGLGGITIPSENTDKADVWSSTTSRAKRWYPKKEWLSLAPFRVDLVLRDAWL